MPEFYTKEEQKQFVSNINSLSVEHAKLVKLFSSEDLSLLKDAARSGVKIEELKSLIEVYLKINYNEILELSELEQQKDLNRFTTVQKAMINALKLERKDRQKAWSHLGQPHYYKSS